MTKIELTALCKGIVGGIKPKFAALEQRVAALETKAAAGVEYAGAHQAGKHYPRGVLCTRQGGLWLTLRDTTETPGIGTPGSDWRLVVKSGWAER